jgi:tetratricopeptide (TPR) repeat protein
MDEVAVYRIFLASPSGLARERQACRDTIEGYNRECINDKILFFPLGWEGVPPGFGNPQSRINTSLEKCDYFMLMLWDRWGTPPGGGHKSTSGSEAEYRCALQCLRADPGERPMRDIAVFFKAVSPDRLKDPGEQLRKVLAFKKRLESQRKLLHATFDSISAFQQVLRGQLAAWKEAHRSGNLKKVGSPLRTKQRLDESFILATSRTAPSKPDVLAAERLARQGRETEADEAFARAIVRGGAEATHSYGQYLLSSGRPTEARRRFQTLLRITAGTEWHWRARAYSGLASIHKLRGEYQQAEKLFRNALSLEKKAGHTGCMADEYTNIGIILKRREDLTGAERMQRRALEIYEGLHETEGVAIVYGNLGVIFRKRRDYTESERLLRESVKLGNQTGSLLALTRAYGNLGVIHRIRGEFDRAEEMFRKSLALNKKLGSLVGQAAQYGYLGLVYRQRGDLRVAEQMLLESLRINEILGSKSGLAKQHTNFGHLYAARGDKVNARNAWLRAVELYHEMGLSNRAKELESLLSS